MQYGRYCKRDFILLQCRLHIFGRSAKSRIGIPGDSGTKVSWPSLWLTSRSWCQELFDVGEGILNGFGQNTQTRVLLRQRNSETELESEWIRFGRRMMAFRGRRRKRGTEFQIGHFWMLPACLGWLQRKCIFWPAGICKNVFFSWKLLFLDFALWVISSKWTTNWSCTST